MLSHADLLRNRLIARVAAAGTVRSLMTMLLEDGEIRTDGVLVRVQGGRGWAPPFVGSVCHKAPRPPHSSQIVPLSDAHYHLRSSRLHIPNQHNHYRYRVRAQAGDCTKFNQPAQNLWMRYASESRTSPLCCTNHRGTYELSVRNAMRYSSSGSCMNACT